MSCVKNSYHCEGPFSAVGLVSLWFLFVVGCATPDGERAASEPVSSNSPLAIENAPSSGSGESEPDGVVFQERNVPYAPFDAARVAVKDFVSQNQKETESALIAAPSEFDPKVSQSAVHLLDAIRFGQLPAARAEIEAVLATRSPRSAPFVELARLILLVDARESDPSLLLAVQRDLQQLQTVSRATLPPQERELLSYFFEVASALVWIRAGDVSAARLHLLAAQSLKPEREEHCLLLARIFLDELEWGAAENVMDNCQGQVANNTPEFYALSIFVKQSRGKTRAASLALRRALDLYPNDPLLTVISAKNEFDRGSRLHPCQQFESLYRSSQSGLSGAQYAAICALAKGNIKMSKNVLEDANLRYGASGQSSQMLFGLYALEGRDEAALSAARAGASAYFGPASTEFQTLAGLLVERLVALGGSQGRSGADGLER